MWTFYDFVDLYGTNVIREWLDSLPGVERAKATAQLDMVLNVLRALPQAQWKEPYWKSMTGKGWGGIYEVRFRVKKVRYRVFACFGPQRYNVTLLLGFDKRGGRGPTKATAYRVQERKDLISDQRHIKPHFA